MVTSPLGPSALAAPARPAAHSTERRGPGRHGIRAAAVAGIVLLAGCLDETSPTDPSLTDPGAPSMNRSPTGHVAERPHEAPFREISQQIRGFGGYFYDDDGNMVAYLRDGAEEERASRPGPAARCPDRSPGMKGPAPSPAGRDARHWRSASF